MSKFYKLVLINVISLSFFSTLMAHDGHSHEAPWKACEESKKEDKCSYTNGNGDLFQGTCQSFKETLMCVRNKPIVKSQENISTSLKSKLVDNNASFPRPPE